ncbi:MAG TPA: zinc-binding dehydrogenase [Actinomycetota bacterium]|nr:zinc-binding dehydrogenase [Actinomycetota bacterium]
MRAVLADLSTPRYLWTAAAGRLKGDAGWGPGGVMRLADVPEPALPKADGWLRIKPELSGICGSDVGLAHAQNSFVMSAFYAEPKAVPGHEVVGVVTEGSLEGQRVLLDPILSCVHRGFEPCRTCREARPYACERFDEPGITGCHAPGQGFSDAVGGGWGESLVAHESQCFPIGDIPSKRAVLAEPAAIGLHAALQWKRTGDRVVVIGPGAIGLLVTAALRMLHPDLDIAMISRGEFGAANALRAGATRTLPGGAAAVEQLAASDGGRVVRPRMTKIPILEQGVDAVFDCVGSPDTIDLSLHLLRPGAMLVLVGAAGKQTADWSLVWSRELTVQGTINAGPEPTLGGKRTMAQVAEWLADPAYPVDGLVTHQFELDEWQKALSTASAGSRAQAVKVTLRPNPDVPLV